MMDETVRQRAAGDWTVDTAEQVWEQASAWDIHGDLILDFDGVSDLDTSGVQILWRLQQHCAETGSALKLENASDSVRAVLSIYGLDQFVAGG